VKLSLLVYSVRVAAHRAGGLGGSGIALLVAAAVLYVFTVIPARQHLSALQNRAERTDSRGAAEAVLRSPLQPSGIRQFVEFFPTLDTAPRWLKSLYAIAERENLELLKGTYRVSEDPALGMVRYTASLPVRGRYPQIRRFIASALNEVPIASLEGVVVQRDKVSDEVVEASVAFTLHLRATPRAVRADALAQVAHSDGPAEEKR
jgi:hypothetical protein